MLTHGRGPLDSSGTAPRGDSPAAGGLSDHPSVHLGINGLSHWERGYFWVLEHLGLDLPMCNRGLNVGHLSPLSGTVTGRDSPALVQQGLTLLC